MPPIKPGFPFCSRVPISIHPIVAGLLLFGHLFGTEAERLPRVDRRRRGRPATAVEIRRLIERMVAANPLWRAPRLHGELRRCSVSGSPSARSPELSVH